MAILLTATVVLLALGSSSADFITPSAGDINCDHAPYDARNPKPHCNPADETSYTTPLTLVGGSGGTEAYSWQK